MENIDNCGFLELVIGPMFSGKTLFLINKFNELNDKGENVLVINHNLDNRYSYTNIVAHNGKCMPISIMAEKLMDIKHDDYKNCKNILINEGQFFQDLSEFTKKLLNQNKNIYISGLDGDFKQKKFGQILDLIPICDKITKLHAKCSLCLKKEIDTKAIFSHRLIESQDTVLIGSSESYIPICRKCNNKFSKEEDLMDVIENISQEINCVIEKLEKIYVDVKKQSSIYHSQIVDRPEELEKLEILTQKWAKVSWLTNDHQNFLRSQAKNNYKEEINSERLREEIKDLKMKIESLEIENKNIKNYNDEFDKILELSLKEC